MEITIIGTGTAERLLDSLLAVEGQNGEDVERVERALFALYDAAGNLVEVLKKARGMVPPDVFELRIDDTKG